jgi:tetratricopeptide (TPR) repeat protein
MVSLWNRTGFSFSRIKMARLSAAKARLSRRAAREERTVWQRIAQALATGWKLLATVVLSLAGVFTFAIIAVLLWQALMQKTIAIAPIGVPRMLAESGYTADVAAQRLHDALNKVVEDAHSRKNGPEVALQTDLPSIVVPTIGLSLETIAADLRTFFHIPGRWNIFGEFTIAQKQLWLRLRVNGQDSFTSANGGDPERPDELLAPAAGKVFEMADPYIAGWSMRERNPGKSLEIARRMIADRPERDQSVPWAHNLVGVILADQYNTEEAIAEYRKAIELDPRIAIFHTNLGVVLSYLGVVLRDQHKTGEAIAEYRKAIELDPRDALPHNNLGNRLLDQGKAGEAIAEYKKAIELDPRYVEPHKKLASILRAQGKTKEADAEDQKAKELGAKHPD